jgi:transposase-like protein
MVKIRPEEHLTIFEKYTYQGISVKELAKQYRCTGANIYHVVNKIRKQNGSATEKLCENSEAAAPNGTELIEAAHHSHLEPGRAASGTVDRQAKVPATANHETIPDGMTAAWETPLVASGERPPRAGRSSGPATLPLELPLPEPQADSDRSPAGAVSQSRPVAPVARRPPAQPRFKDAVGGQKRGSVQKGVGVLIRSDDGDETIPCPNIETAMQNARAILRQTVGNPGMWIRLEEIDLSEFRGDADTAA